jgi:hypothetical protein
MEPSPVGTEEICHSERSRSARDGNRGIRCPSAHDFPKIVISKNSLFSKGTAFTVPIQRPQTIAAFKAAFFIAHISGTPVGRFCQRALRSA